MNFLYQLHKKQSLMFRVMLITFIIVFAAMLLFSFYAGNILYKNTFEDAKKYSFQLFEQMSKNISNYISTMDNIAAVTSRQSDVLGHLLVDPVSKTSASSYYQFMNPVRTFLINMTSAQDYIEYVAVISDWHNYYVDNTTNVLYVTYPFRDEGWYQQAIENPDTTFVLPPRIPEYLEGLQTPVISYVRSIKAYENGPPLGVVLIDLKSEAIESLSNDISLGDSGYAFIINSKGEYIYYPNKEFLDTGNQDLNFPDSAYIDAVLGGDTSFIAKNNAGENNAVFSTPVEGTDWYLVGIIPYAQLSNPAISLRTTQILLGLIIAAVVCLLIALFIRSSIFKRLLLLRSVMAQVESGNLDVSFDAGTNDEIGKLGNGFNAMIARLKELIGNISKTENQKRKAEFAALQAQINPHFLYNTLDSIVWMAEANPAGAAEMAYLLGTFFRQSLSGGNDIVPLSQELSIAEAYLNIQRIRYESYFDYDIHYTQEVADFLVPKVIVQPLVENAIYHGIKQSEKKCHLSIYAYKYNDYIFIEVVDDGVGISKQILAEVMSGKRITNGMNGVGVKNVEERIQLRFTKKSGLYYQSHKGNGTLSCIYIYVGK